MNADPEESAGACYTHAPDISEEARANRQLLGTVLTAAGLVNYPTEWWHWSFGDRYWALLTESPRPFTAPRSSTRATDRPDVLFRPGQRTDGEPSALGRQ